MRSYVCAAFAVACAVSLSGGAEADEPTSLQVRQGVPVSRSAFRTAVLHADEPAQPAEQEPATPRDEPAPVAEPTPEPPEGQSPAPPAPAEGYYQEQEEDAAPAPGDYLAAPDAAAKPSCDSEDSSSSSQSCCGSGEEEEEEDEPWALFDCCCLKEKSITMSGWVDFGFTTNADDPLNPAAGNGNLPQTFNYRSNEFQLNQLYLYAEKATETSCCDCWDIGWRADVLYGSDYIFSEALGLETNLDGTQQINSDHGNGIFGTGTTGLAIPQMYAEVAWDDVKVKLGHWYTPVGYETVTAVDNYFYSHLLTHQYGEPFTHTGALATWTMNKKWTVFAGFTRGWDNWEDNNEDLAFLGGISWKSCDEKTSWTYSIHNGAENVPGRPAGADNRFYHSFVFKRTLGDKWNYVLEHDLGIQDNGEAVAGGGFQDAEWYSLSNYLFYTINDCWSAGVRYEWFNDDDGVRAGALLVNPTGIVYDGHYQDITLGLNWTPGTNLRVRPEVRWDWFDPHSGSAGSPGPFDNLTSRSQFTAAVDVIVKY